MGRRTPCGAVVPLLELNMIGSIPSWLHIQRAILDVIYDTNDLERMVFVERIRDGLSQRILAGNNLRSHGSIDQGNARLGGIIFFAEESSLAQPCAQRLKVPDAYAALVCFVALSNVARRPRQGGAGRSESGGKELVWLTVRALQNSGPSFHHSSETPPRVNVAHCVVNVNVVSAGSFA
jgi:hypothetical protein